MQAADRGYREHKVFTMSHLKQYQGNSNCIPHIANSNFKFISLFKLLF